MSHRQFSDTGSFWLCTQPKTFENHIWDGGEADAQIRCWLCSVPFDTQRQYLQHFMTKPHAEMEDIQKRTDAMEFEVPVEFEISVHVPSQAEATQASLVPAQQTNSWNLSHPVRRSIAYNIMFLSLQLYHSLLFTPFTVWSSWNSCGRHISLPATSEQSAGAHHRFQTDRSTREGQSSTLPAKWWYGPASCAVV